MGNITDDDDRKLPAPRRPASIPALFDELGIGRVSTNDKFTVSYQGGMLKATVKHADGVAKTVVREVGTGFRAMTEFDPAEMRSKEDRNRQIRKLVNKGATQQEVAEEFGLSQSMVNKIINSKS